MLTVVEIAVAEEVQVGLWFRIRQYGREVGVRLEVNLRLEAAIARARGWHI
jgi:hypothetical protein